MNSAEKDYTSIKETTITGRYVTHMKIQEYLRKGVSVFSVETIGSSVENRPIQQITLGTGPIRVFMWSQMHGNESTTTKAVLDFINWVGLDFPLQSHILSKCTIKIIPILNPDGAFAYTRVNANEIDLNRDAQERSQPESRLLRTVFDDFKPHFCFNLHDQRTIFNVGTTQKPATVSFLAPAHDKERSISATRAISMQLIAAMGDELEAWIPGQIGRFDDSFNSNCVGDSFQMLGVPTILFEAGHFPEDYQRERTREFIFRALTKALETIALETIGNYSTQDYFSIPENGKLFFDVLIKNAHLIHKKYEIGSSVGLLYREVLRENKIEFELQIAETGALGAYFGHKTYDCAEENIPDLLSKNDNIIAKLLV